ncbi:hypothetical protein [Candidatus Frankia nodulisporulans]|uniref:hypothetical protein n=1 Tax=Candidatus Frankia nodulisporulans TaxID=2060052 RepID=UPI0013D73BB3|nr:hypothetical protein [Candidatus Frankia nodulisporulans]
MASRINKIVQAHAQRAALERQMETVTGAARRRLERQHQALLNDATALTRDAIADGIDPSTVQFALEVHGHREPSTDAARTGRVLRDTLRGPDGRQLIAGLAQDDSGVILAQAGIVGRELYGGDGTTAGR